MDCVFCDKERIKDDIIYESNNFFVKVGIGLASPGHVMLIPKKHYIGFVYMPEEHLKEYEEVKKLVFNNVKKCFSEPFLVEYCKVAQSVPHSHLHFIPKIREKTQYYTCYKINDLIKDIKIPYKMLDQKYSIKRLRYLRENNKEYIYLFYKKAYLFSDFIKEFPAMNLKWRRFFNDTYHIKDILYNWTKITKNERIIDEYNRNITKKLLKF
jgi:histidine triad (HIT) family protein